MRSALFVAVATALILIVPAGRSQADSATSRTVRGKVVQVQPGQNELTVRTRAGKDLRLQVDDRSTIRIGQQTGQLRQLKAGDRVRVTYTPGEDGGRVAELSRLPVSAADVRQEIKRTLAEAKDYSFRQKNRYEKKLRQVLGDTEDRIEELKAQAQRKGGQFLQNHQAQIQDLRAKAQVVRKKLDQVEHASARTWNKVKSDVGTALHELHNTYDQLRERFSK
jgi:2',3'-cyclic-nucleotide 2'-phosphodiesterase (5'-nucleotidase family)